MNDLKNFVRDLGYFGVGAAAVIVETGSKAVKALVRKGAKVLQENQDTVDDIKRKAKEAGERIKDALEKASAPQEDPTVEEPAVEEPIVEEPTVEEPIVEEPTIEEPIAEKDPVVPDAIYRTADPVPQDEHPDDPEPAIADDPAPADESKPDAPLAAEFPDDAEKPEETING